MNYVEERIGRLLEELEKAGFRPVEALPCCEWLESRTELLEEAVSNKGWRRFGREDRFGGVDEVVWFRFSIKTPAMCQGNPVLFRITTGREGEWYPGGPQYMVYVNGMVKQGMDLFHRHIRLTEEGKPGEVFEVYLQAFSGVKETLTGMRVDILREEPVVRALYYHIKTAFDGAKLLGEMEKIRYTVMDILNTALNIPDFRDPFSEVYLQGMEAASRYLHNHLYGKFHGDGLVTAHTVGHTHLDIAWLWTIEDSRRKAARTFANTLQLMQRYEDYTFTATQPAIYRFVEEDFPELFGLAKQRIAENRWETEGAMWVEPDCNIPSGESFIRQLLLGKGYIMRHFGKESRVLFLPDTFGFTAALPQILKRAGVDYFITTKLSWNDTNRFPSDVFRWRGIDGTEILGYFTNQHAAYLGPQPLKDVWKDNRQKEMISNILVPFGWGDAGGGATEGMLEAGKRLSQGLAGMPKLKSSSLCGFMDALKEEVWENRRLPVWNGELYLELHRGTYTSSARSKWYNRKSEMLLQAAETFAVLASTAAGMTYFKDSLRKSWELVALNQFHDILPGSSVREVYQRSFAEYETVLESGEQIVKTALQAVADKIALEQDAVIIFNPLGFEATNIAVLPRGLPDTSWLSDGKTNYPVQRTAGGVRIVCPAGVPAKGYTALYPVSAPAAGGTIRTKQLSEGIEVDSAYYHAVIAHNGQLVSLFDKTACREVFYGSEAGNVLEAYEDMPIYFNDAWDIAGYFDEKLWIPQADCDCVVEESGPVRTVLRIKLKFSHSDITQRIIFYESIRRIDFDTSVDWKEKFVLLKAAFPLNVHTDTASFDIQFGQIKRPTHRNTSWEQAKFEVCGHKWADLSQEDFGVSVLNDCKYGWDVVNNKLRLTLLKSSEYPNVEADRHLHHFTYALHPHQGRLEESETVHQSYQLNMPLYPLFQKAQPGTLPDHYALFRVDVSHVILETVKQTEDGTGILVRLYEAYNRSGEVVLYCGMTVKRAYACDLLERVEEELPCKNQQLNFSVSPFEVKSFILEVETEQEA